MAIRFRAWLALLRPPNFFTVPGDALAGYLLAAGVAGRLWDPGLLEVILASLCFYAGGLLLNDWADFEVDRMERPQRPLPSGLVSRGAALVVAAGFLGGGLALSALQGREVSLIGGALLLTVVNYNLLLKHVPVIGAVAMGGCRALSFLLGAVLVHGFEFVPLTIWGAATLWAFITVVTHIARTEMVGRYFTVERWAPALVIVGSFLAYLPFSPLLEKKTQLAVPVLFFLATVSAAKVAVLLPDRRGTTSMTGVKLPVPVPALVGRLIGLLIPMQSAFIIGSGDENWRIWLGLGILLLWPVKTWAGRIFYSS